MSLEGRSRQKLRTRRDLLEAARVLLSRGLVPTVASAAAEGGISRATAYRFFPSQELLLAEALLGVVSRQIEAVLYTPTFPSEAEARLDILMHTAYAAIEQHEGALRAFLRHSLEEVASPVALKRSGRRLEYIDHALLPVAASIEPARYSTLRHTLAALLGIEPTIVFRDICTLSPGESVEVAWQAARALLRASLAPSDGKTPDPPPAHPKKKKKKKGSREK